MPAGYHPKAVKESIPFLPLTPRTRWRPLGGP